MEKTKIAMSNLIAGLDQMNVVSGAEKATYREQIQTLDACVDGFIKSALADGISDVEYRERDLLPSADIRTAAFEADLRQEAQYPESLLPMAADVLCRRVSDWFHDRLLFARTTTFRGTFEVGVAGGLHPPYLSGSSNPVSDREKYEKKIEQLRAEGWIYKSRNNSLEITDDPSNLERIRQYVAQLEGRHLRMDLWDGIVRGFTFRIPSDKCLDVFLSISGQKEDQPVEQASTKVSDDDVAVINRNLKDIKAALSSIGFMDDRSVILSLLRSYTADIEKALNAEDLICSQTIRQRHAEEARKNRALRSRQEDKGEQVLSTLDLRAAYGKIESGLQKALCEVGLWVTDLEFFSYASTRFKGIPRTYYGERTLRSELSTVNEPGDRMVYLRNDPENIDRVVDILRAFMPGIRVETFQVRIRDFGQVVNEMTFTLSPSDIASMLEKTKDMEDASPF